MPRRKLMKGGSEKLGVAWMYVATFMVGLVVGGMALWWKSRVQAEPSPAVIVVSQPVTSGPSVAPASNSRLPVYPDKDPVYPLRNAGQAEYQQLGVLKSLDGSEPIALPLFGRRMAARPDRWEYYTATDKQNMLRIPIVFENRDCLEDDVGCNEVYKGDQVEVPVYGKKFEVQLYKYDK